MKDTILHQHLPLGEGGAALMKIHLELPKESKGGRHTCNRLSHKVNCEPQVNQETRYGSALH